MQDYFPTRLVLFGVVGLGGGWELTLDRTSFLAGLAHTPTQGAMSTCLCLFP